MSGCVKLLAKLNSQRHRQKFCLKQCSSSNKFHQQADPFLMAAKGINFFLFPFTMGSCNCYVIIFFIYSAQITTTKFDFCSGNWTTASLVQTFCFKHWQQLLLISRGAGDQCSKFSSSPDLVFLVLHLVLLGASLCGGRCQRRANNCCPLVQQAEM